MGYSSANSHVGATDGFVDDAWLAGTEPETYWRTRRSPPAAQGEGTSSVVANNAGDHFERALRLGGGVGDETIVNLDGNCYRAGPRTFAGEAVIGMTGTDAKGPITAYIAYHETDPSLMPVTGNGDGIRTISRLPLRPDDLETVRGGQAYDAVLSGVGARPTDRTPNDERISPQVRPGRTNSGVPLSSSPQPIPEDETSEPRFLTPRHRRS